jgi:hypothetical protein
LLQLKFTDLTADFANQSFDLDTVALPGLLGATGSTPLLERFHSPLDTSKAEKRWLEGFYMDVPEEWDDPYRFFRW